MGSNPIRRFTFCQHTLFFFLTKRQGLMIRNKTPTIHSKKHRNTSVKYVKVSFVGRRLKPLFRRHNRLHIVTPRSAFDLKHFSKRHDLRVQWIHSHMPCVKSTVPIVHRLQMMYLAQLSKVIVAKALTSPSFLSRRSCRFPLPVY